MWKKVINWTASDVPEMIREQLYDQEQQRLERKGATHSGATSAYHPINIMNVLPTQSCQMSTAAIPSDSKIVEWLNIPGLHDWAVAEYSNWQQSTVSDEILKTEFRKACDVALEDGLDLMQIHEDQDPEFFIKYGVKRGIARRFVGDILYWFKQYKCDMDGLQHKKPLCCLKIINGYGEYK